MNSERIRDHSEASLDLFRDEQVKESIVASLTALDFLRYCAGWRFDLRTSADSVTVLGTAPDGRSHDLTAPDLIMALNNWSADFGMPEVRRLVELDQAAP